MLTQEQCDEQKEAAKRRARETAEGEEEEDDDNDSEEGYISPKDPFPREARRMPMEEDLDKDFGSNEEVGIKPQLVNFAKALVVLPLVTL